MKTLIQVHLNVDGGMHDYQPHHRLVPVEPVFEANPAEIANLLDWTWHVTNADVDMLHGFDAVQAAAYRANRNRSTCMGDVFVVTDPVGNSSRHVVAAFGFEPLPNDTPLNTVEGDWMSLTRENYR